VRDQVNKLQSLGISAACINSNQSSDENNEVLNQAINGQIKVLYIAPERQNNEMWLSAAEKMKLSMVVVDEAHCISVWGHDFRPAFKKISKLVDLLPKNFPVLGTTATTTYRTQKDIEKQLKLVGGELSVVRGDLMRSKFRLYVVKVKSEEEKMIWLAQNLKKLPGSGIIYTGTRVDTEVYNNWLRHQNINSTQYNGGLDSETRKEVEDGLMQNKWKCIVSTNALGMGIDKPDIRFIIHTQIPASIIHYYQEIGRAGRDGLPSDIILFYNEEDKKLPLAFIENSKPKLALYNRVIEASKEDLYGEKELMKKCNVRQTPFRVIKEDLIDQRIWNEITIGRSKKYEFVSSSKPLDTSYFEDIRDQKRHELEQMIAYTETTSSRMKFICNYLGDVGDARNFTCDNTGLETKKITVSKEWFDQIEEFRNNFFPELLLSSKNSNIINGVAASYYGVSIVGSAIHRSKYEKGGDFPDFLLGLTLRACRKSFGNLNFDVVLYVPPTSSGDLVKNFATKISAALKVPISHHLKKVRETSEQKIFENNYLKSENVADAFSFSGNISGKNVLLIDDICDSGATLKEIGKILTSLGANLIAPLVIAKTVGGDL
jgi:ATP-dependent DNA helicase RecQ